MNQLMVDLSDAASIQQAISLLTPMVQPQAVTAAPGPAPTQAAPAPAPQPAPSPSVAPASAPGAAPVPGAPAPAPTPAPAPAPAPAAGVDVDGLKAQLKQISAQLGPRVNEVGTLIQAQGVNKVSELSVEQLAHVVQQAQGLLASG